MNGSRWQDRRVWLGGGALAGLLVIVASWMLIISPALDSATALRAQESDAQTQNTLTMTKNSKLAKQNEQIGARKKELLAALRGLPTTTDLPAFTLQVTALATADKVALSSVGFSQPASVGPAATASTDPSSAPSATTDTATPSAGTAAAPTATMTTVTLATTGTVEAQTRFLADLRTGTRRALVSTTQFATATPRATTLTTQLTIFSAAMSKAQLDSINRDLRAN